MPLSPTIEIHYDEFILKEIFYKNILSLEYPKLTFLNSKDPP
jgi:hypothetical protein